MRHNTRQQVLPATEAREGLIGYHAFLSYSQAADGKLAPALQSALHRFAKPWYRIRAVRVFRDKTSLAVTAALWSGIKSALDQAEHFILLASKDAAASPWVEREVKYWLAIRPVDRFLLVLTDGELVWDQRRGAFDPERTNALPAPLRQAFSEEPLYLDLRWARAENQLTLSHPRFREAVAELAATLHRRSKEEIVGEDARQHRRTRRLAWSAAAGLTVLTAASVAGAFVAVRQKEAADAQRAAALEQSRISLARQLAAQSEVIRVQFPERLPLAALLAVESTRLHPSLEGNAALRSALALMPEPLRRFPYAGVDPQRARVRAMAFSPDGMRLAVAREDGAAEILAAAEGRRVGLLEHGDNPGAVEGNSGGGFRWKATGVDAEVVALAFSPDGRTLVTGSNDGTARWWDVETGRQVASFSHDGGVVTVAFAPSGRYVATGGKDGAARVWEAPSRRMAAEFRLDDEVREIAFSPDGARIAGISTAGSVVLWDLKSRGAVREWFAGIAGLGLEFSLDGALLAAVGGEVARVWDVKSGEKLVEVTHVNHPAQDQGHLTWIVDATLSRDGKYLATGGRDGTARVWSLETGHEVVRLSHAAPVTAVTFHPDGTALGTASFDGASRLWELPSGRERLRAVHPGGSEVVAFRPDGAQVASGGVDGGILQWGLSSGDQAAFLPHAGEVRAVDFSPDGQRIVTASRGGFVRLWTAAGQPASPPLKLPIPTIDRVVFHESGAAGALWSRSHVFHINPSREPAVALLADHRTAAAAALSRRYVAATRADLRGLRLWSTADGSEVKAIETDRAWDPVFDSTGDALVTEHEGGVLRLWAVPELRAIGQVTAGTSSPEYAVSPGGGSLAIWAAEKQGERNEWKRYLDVWDVAAERRVLRIPHEEEIEWLAFSPGGAPLVAGRGNEIQLWDLQTGRATARLRHEEDVRGVRFSPEEGILATFSGAGVSVWDYARATLLSRIPGGGVVFDLRFSPDGRLLLTGSSEGGAVWRWKNDDLCAEACRRLDRNLSREEWESYLGAVAYRPSCPDLPPGE